MLRRAARELALKILFQIDVGKIPLEEALALSLPKNENSKVKAFATQLVAGTVQALEKIDRVISQYAIDWHLDRMANIDRNILRLAVYELLFLPDVPVSVSVNEAVELAKKYGDVNSPRFINGILGNVVRQETLSKL